MAKDTLTFIFCSKCLKIYDLLIFFLILQYEIQKQKTMNIRIISKQVAIPKCRSTGKWYARAQHIGTVSSEQLAEELSQSSSVTQADLVAFSLFSEHNGISRDNVEAGVIPAPYGEPSIPRFDFQIMPGKLHGLILSCFLYAFSRYSSPNLKETEKPPTLQRQTTRRRLLATTTATRRDSVTLSASLPAPTEHHPSPRGEGAR